MKELMYKMDRATEIIKFYKKLFNSKDKYIKYCESRNLNPDAEDTKKEWKETLLSCAKWEIDRI